MRKIFYNLSELFIVPLLLVTMLHAQKLHPTKNSGTNSSFDNTAQTLPFSQDWSNTGMITSNDDWSGVPGITGYLGDDASISTTGIDPQTITADLFITVDVIANQINTTSTTGGVGEFEIANPVVALQGSGTADFPHIVISLNATGASGIRVQYDLRDIDGSADNAVQPVALQYRVGSSGSFTNIAAGFVADATTGPSLATLSTHVDVTLPGAADNQSLVQIRIITANATGADEWVGIDDISISAGINISGTGGANPSTINAGNSTLLTVNVTPATNPASTGITVFGDLSSIGGSSSQQFFDNGTGGDVTFGDNIFSFEVVVPVDNSVGFKVLPIDIDDAEIRTGSTTIDLTIIAPLPVELISFTAVANPTRAGRGVELVWKTATEVDNHGFEVERKEVRVSGFQVRVSNHEPQTSNQTWHRIGFIEGNGTTNAPKEYSFIDKNLIAETYSYRLKQIDRDGKFSYSQEVEVSVGTAPKVFALEQNYPNPFNPSTTIRFTIQVSGFTSLKIYDTIGREVTALVNEELEAGVYHQRTFDASNLASGIYFSRLTSGNNVELKKMQLIK